MTHDPDQQPGGETARGDQASGEKSYWLDEPRNVTKIVWVLVVLCAGLFFADGFYVKHAETKAEYLFGFYAIFGFTVYVGLVLVAKWLRTILMRPEDYYDSDD
jgi:hypothetical protein